MFQNNYRFVIAMRSAALLVALAFAVVFTMFLYLEKLLWGKIIWKEVFIAGYFLIAVGLVVAVAKGLFRQLVIFATQRIKNVLLQKSTRLLFQGLFWAAIIFPFLLATFTIHRPKIGDRMNPQSALGLSYEKISFKTPDNIWLDGWYLPGSGDKTVIIGHGLGANKSNFLSVVDLWHGLGFKVLIFDFRGHGQSEGHTISFGYKERKDIEAALDYLGTRRDVDPQKIMGYGVSFGGVAMIQAAAEDPRLQAIVIDSAYADMDAMALQTVKKIGFVPAGFLKIIADVGLSMASLENGFDMRKFSPQRAMAKVKQPVLLIHGRKDSLIPAEESEKLFKAAQDPKFLYILDTQGHYTTMDHPGYPIILRDFLKQVRWQ